MVLSIYIVVSRKGTTFENGILAAKNGDPMDMTKLTNIGLTNGEVKIYEALLEIGETTRTELAKKSGISPSKIYDVANRLLEKGIISSVTKNGVIHFSPANPERLRDFLEQKERELDNERKVVEQLLPRLLLKYNTAKEATDVEVFHGWEGMTTVYDDIVGALGKGDYNYVFGASSGVDEAQADIFFNQYYQKKERKGYATRIIFNENVRHNAARIQPFKQSPNEARFLHQDTFTEIHLYKDIVLFVMLLKKPIVIRVHSQEAADSCKKFFDTLWAQATP